MSLTVIVVSISSPETTSGPQRNSWALCSRRAKSIPTSGSNMAGPSATPQKTTQNIGGATTSR